MDISHLTPDQIASLRAQLGLTADPTGRSPMKPRQLHDLRLLPTKDDPRPTFFWSAESPRTGEDLNRTTPYPRLMWAPNGQEVTVADANEQRDYAAQGYALTAPANAVALNPLEQIQAALAQLSEEDRKVIIEAQDMDRKAALKAQLAALSASDLQAVLDSVAPAVPAKKTKVA